MSADHYLVPKVNFESCPNAKIYVNNNIINPPYSPSSSPPSLAISKPSNGDNIPNQQVDIDPKTGGRVNIYCGQDNADRNSLPMISVEIRKLTPDGTEGTEIEPAYVITVHTNNVHGEGALTEPVSKAVLHEMIKADNVVLNSSGDLNVGPGAGGENKGKFSASLNKCECKCNSSHKNK